MRIGLAGTGRIGSFHASTLAALDEVEELVVHDVVPEAAQRLAAEHGYAVAASLEELLGRVDAVVVTTATTGHADTVRAALAADRPVFCEKPVATTLEDTLDVVARAEAAGVPVQVGFQRRFDAGYRRAKQAVDVGELGFVHTLRATTHDQSPPPAAYLPTSGGLLRDCSIHDFDILRFVTGREVATVYAVGANKGEDFFVEAGDVDTAAALLTLDDGTLASVTATRYNGGGHDVRLEVLGSQGAIGVGYDDSLAIRSAEEGADYPRGPQKWSYLERFEPAYRAELAAFCDVAAGRAPSPCTPRDGLAAFRVAEAADRSRATGRPVPLDEIGDAP